MFSYVYVAFHLTFGEKYSFHISFMHKFHGGIYCAYKSSPTVVTGSIKCISYQAFIFLLRSEFAILLPVCISSSYKLYLTQNYVIWIMTCLIKMICNTINIFSLSFYKKRIKLCMYLIKTLKWKELISSHLLINGNKKSYLEKQKGQYHQSLLHSNTELSKVIERIWFE